MVSFLSENKLKYIKFMRKLFLTNISIKIVSKIAFYNLYNINKPFKNKN